MAKNDYLLQEESTDFDKEVITYLGSVEYGKQIIKSSISRNILIQDDWYWYKEVHSSNLLHPTKERPKSCRRNSSRVGNDAKSVAKEIRKQAETTENESSLLLPPPTSPKPKKFRTTNTPPPVSSKPKPKVLESKSGYHPETVQENKSSIFNKKQSLFKLPALGELRGKKLRKTGKRPEKKEKKEDDDASIQLIKYDKDIVDENDGKNQCPSTTTTQKEQPKIEPAITTKRGGSVRVRISGKESNDESNRIVKRSFSTGRDVRSLREKLESGGNTLRNGISRFGNSVTSRTSMRENKRIGSKEKSDLLISDDPDENTNEIVKIKDEEKKKIEVVDEKPVKTTTKDKLRLTSGQSVKITTRNTPPKIPTYKKLSESPESPRKFEDEQKWQTTTEQPVEKYNKLRTSPEIQRSQKLSKSTSEDFYDVEIIARDSKKSNRLEQPILNSMKTQESVKLASKLSSVQNISKDNKTIDKQQALKQEKIAEGFGKQNIVNPVTSLRPQTSEKDQLKPSLSTNGHNTPKYGNVRMNENTTSDNRTPLSRSFTWNTYKPMKVNEQKQRDITEKNYVKDDSVYSPPAIKKSYSVKTYTPQPVRRKVDEQGRILNKRGSAQKNILSVLPLFGNKGKKEVHSPDKSIVERSDEKSKLIGEKEEEMASTDLYENNFKKSNARKASQDSWLGKSGLFDFDSSSKQKVSLVDKNVTNSNKQKAPEKQHLLQEDWDEDSFLDRSIGEQNNNNSGEQSQNNEKTKKSKLSGLSFKKKYNFDKI